MGCSHAGDLAPAVHTSTIWTMPRCSGGGRERRYRGPADTHVGTSHSSKSGSMRVAPLRAHPAQGSEPSIAAQHGPSSLSPLQEGGRSSTHGGLRSMVWLAEIWVAPDVPSVVTLCRPRDLVRGAPVLGDHYHPDSVGSHGGVCRLSEPPPRYRFRYAIRKALASRQRFLPYCLRCSEVLQLVALQQRSLSYA
jgi:hypothetical protein